ncbi:hypothetical protein PoB_006144300 [Plakobranchus ocellatus]|uniref:Uncharacterized protein n=1 Tax=Plakobranchus ocellatus TaxID=259542 RepID=A0AAV4CSW4_9GAST|nr:hypothetical protein PoB_006144300 [Plakobranchus ocellatus]
MLSINVTINAALESDSDFEAADIYLELPEVPDDTDSDSQDEDGLIAKKGQALKNSTGSRISPLYVIGTNTEESVENHNETVREMPKCTSASSLLQQLSNKAMKHNILIVSWGRNDIPSLTNV